MKKITMVFLDGSGANLEVGESHENNDGTKSPKILAINYNQTQTAIELKLEDGSTFVHPLSSILKFSYI